MKDNQYAVLDIKDLVAYQKAKDAMVDVYAATKNFPPSETYGLVSQGQRAASSIGLNLAEGNGVQYIQKKISFVDNAIGSTNEMIAWTDMVHAIGYISQEEHDSLTDKFSEIMRILIGYMKKLKKDADNQ